MDGAVGRSSTLRSLVRPVSPLSRLHKPPLPVENDNHLFTPSISRRITRSGRSRSRSPILSSTVHLPTPLLNDLHGAKAVGQTNIIGTTPAPTPASTNNTSTTETEEVRRIIIRRSSQGIDHVPYQDLTNPDRSDQSKSTTNRSNEFSNKPTLSYRMARRIRMPPPPSNLDRTQTCPILVRMFYSTNGRHYSLSEYVKGRVPENEVRINTWIDATLRELADEIRVVCRLARRRGARLQFAAVYPDREGGFQRRQLGVVITGYGGGAAGAGLNTKSGEGGDDQDDPDNAQRSFNLTDDSAVTLLSKRFQIGDYIDVAIVEYVPGTLSGWSSGRRPMGPPPSSSEARNSAREELRRI